MLVYCTTCKKSMQAQVQLIAGYSRCIYKLPKLAWSCCNNMDSVDQINIHVSKKCGVAMKILMIATCFPVSFNCCPIFILIGQFNSRISTNLLWTLIVHCSSANTIEWLILLIMGSDYKTWTGPDHEDGIHVIHFTDHGPCFSRNLPFHGPGNLVPSPARTLDSRILYPALSPKNLDVVTPTLNTNP